MNLICFFEDLLETGRFLDCLFFAGGGEGVGRGKGANLMIFLTIASLSNENADVPDVMNENGKLNISLDGSLLSHTMNLNTIVLGPPVRNLSSQSTEKEKISTSGFHF